MLFKPGVTASLEPYGTEGTLRLVVREVGADGKTLTVTAIHEVEAQRWTDPTRAIAFLADQAVSFLLAGPLPKRTIRSVKDRTRRVK